VCVCVFSSVRMWAWSKRPEDSISFEVSVCSKQTACPTRQPAHRSAGISEAFIFFGRLQFGVARCVYLFSGLPPVSFPSTTSLDEPNGALESYKLLHLATLSAPCENKKRYTTALYNGDMSFECVFQLSVVSQK